MAAPKKLLVLDLGMQALRLAEFSATPAGELKLLRGARREFFLDPALETSRPEQIQVALQEILKEWKLRRSGVVCVLPAHTVFTRVVPIDVPGGIGGKIDSVVNFEAQQNIPFPLDQVIWDYLPMGEIPSGAVNVVFVAVKTDLLESLSKAISSTGLSIISFSVAPLALYDAFRITYPEHVDSTTMLLDIGSRTSNIIISGPVSFFSRSIPSGGLAVTSAIARDIHAELEEAERLKISQGSVALGAGFEPPTNPVEANVARVARQTLIRTQADISRSISYYRTNMGGTDPEHVLLTGGMASLPYLAEFFEEKLQKKVSFFDPLRGISSNESANSTTESFINSNSNNLGELVGGALEAVRPGKNVINLDLLPPSLARKRRLYKRLPWLVVAAALFLSAIASWYVFAVSATSEIHAQTAKLTEEVRVKKDVWNNIQNLLTKQSAIEETSTSLLSLVQLREFYPLILEDLSARIPSHFLWITDIQAAGDAPKKGASKKGMDPSIKAVEVNGLYLDNPREAAVIDDFVTALQSSAIFAVEEKEKSKIITKRGSPNGGYWAYPFSLRIPLRTPITPLP